MACLRWLWGDSRLEPKPLLNVLYSAYFTNPVLIFTLA